MPNNPIKAGFKCCVFAVVAMVISAHFKVYNFTSGPLVEELAQGQNLCPGTIKQRAVGFPESLKSVNFSKGGYACERVGDICYYVFEDRSRVCFVNVFPEAMEIHVVRVQLDGNLQYQSIPPPPLVACLQ